MFQKGEVSSNYSRSLAVERASQEFEEGARSFKKLFIASVIMLVLLIFTSVLQAKISVGLCILSIGLGLTSMISFLNIRSLNSRAEELKKQSIYDL